ncbi:S8 family serine peptidase [Gordonia bronchialis]|uniref:S8 family serine peptidase n=1 Tax=Gordonia bronchialis TaxID=2054 RepID=UPI00242EA15D|nr:S8 family serine peptidase [Gordonia bronchialis]
MTTSETSGRMLVVFGDPEADAAAALRDIAGISRVRSTADFHGQAIDMSDAASAQATLYAELGVVLVDVDDDQGAALRAAAQRRVLSVEPELVFRALPGRSERAARVQTTFADTDAYTWGLQATRVDHTTATGAGTKVAVLDTGFAFDHPDFEGRPIISESFVAGEDATDRQGHGTHCAGTVCGPAKPDTGPRYGVAPAAELYVGKVLGDDGTGTDGNILAGLNWAVASGCQVVSMSLGADVRTPSAAYERVGSRALAAGTLIVAAAGNNANRPADPGFVGVPANSTSIMAVAAVDPALAVAPFSAAAIDVDGGEIDIAAPGVDVYSTWLMPQRYNTISGTSMATPHVAGLAALWHQRTGATGAYLWTALTGAAERLRGAPTDVGSGLSVAP